MKLGILSPMVSVWNAMFPVNLVKALIKMTVQVVLRVNCCKIINVVKIMEDFN